MKEKQYNLYDFISQPSRNHMQNQSLTSMRITESIPAVILVTSRYENQFLSLSYTVNVAILLEFDSHELRQKLAPENWKLLTQVKTFKWATVYCFSFWR